MANPSKQRGTAWESAVVTWLRANGFPYAERRTLAGANDKGDVSGVPGVVLECKATKSITLSTFVDELLVEMANADADAHPSVPAHVGAVVIKRRGTTDVGRAYAVMPMDVFVRLIGDN